MKIHDVDLQDPPESDLPRGLAAPARRALVESGYIRLAFLAELSEVEVMHLHGVGPAAVKILRRALAEKGLAFRQPTG